MLNKLALHHKTFGQGEPVVILHGLFGTLDNWQTIGKLLAEHYMVFLLDQRNHGRSPHVEGMNYSLLAEDLYHFLDANWIHQTHIIGHSMGGKTAMQFALHHPDLVNRLMIIDIAPKSYEGGHELILDALTAFPLDKISDRKEAEIFLQQKGIKEFGTRQFLLKNLTRTASGGYEWKMNLGEITKHYQEILANIEASDTFEGETLFVKGGNSNYILDEDLPVIQTYFPKANIETVPNVGHWVHAEAPEKLLQLILQFLKK
jgi:pimeloyl-ACP methyl ester carboxylesterase